MPATLLVDAVGSVIAIDLTALDEDDETAVRRAWADATVPTGDPAQTVHPIVAEQVLMLSSLSQQVTLAAIEAARGRAWMLHAAGIATPDGRVVVLVGASGRGKTTASRALGAAYGYVSDETVAIDDDGRVWPYRKPLSVIEDPDQPKTQHPPSALGLLPLPSGHLRVAAVVLLDRDEAGPDLPTVEITDTADAIAELVAQTSFLHHQPAGLRFISALADATGGIRTVTYREASSLPSVIPELMGATAPIDVRELPTHSPPTPRGDGRGPRFSRRSVADEVELEDTGGIALLTVHEGGQGHVSVLGGIAPAVWRAADAATLEQLVDAATAEYGDPDGFDAGAAVLVAVGQLLDAKLLTSDEPVLSRRDDAVRAGGDDGPASQVWDWLAEPVTLTQLAGRATEAAGHEAAPGIAADVERLVDRWADSLLVGPQPAPDFPVSQAAEGSEAAAEGTEVPAEGSQLH